MKAQKNRIVNLRERKGWSRAQLVREIQVHEPYVSAQTVCYWELYGGKPGYRYAKVLSKIFNKPVGYFLTD